MWLWRCAALAQRGINMPMSEPEAPGTQPAFLNVLMRLETDAANANDDAVQEVVEAMARVAGSLGFSATSEVKVAINRDLPGAASQSENDGADDDSVEPEVKLQRALNMDIDEALRSITGDSRRYVGSNKLRCRGIARVRDALVVGRARVFQTPTVGPSMIGYLETFIERRCPEVRPWEDHPTIADIVRVCPELSDVTAATIGVGLGEASPKGSGFEPATRVTIQDILTMPLKDLESLYSQEGHESRFLWDEPAGYDELEDPSAASDTTIIALNIRNEAKRFAEKFLAEHARQAQILQNQNAESMTA